MGFLFHFSFKCLEAVLILNVHHELRPVSMYHILEGKNYPLRRGKDLILEIPQKRYLRIENLGWEHFLKAFASFNLKETVPRPTPRPTGTQQVLPDFYNEKIISEISGKLLFLLQFQ